jgi:Mg-chelatase subunit ChlD
VDHDQYRRLANDLGFKDIKEMTQLAVQEDNIDALMSLAQNNVYAVTAELNHEKYKQFFSKKEQEDRADFIPNLYFMVKSHAPLELKRLLWNLSRNIILKKSLRISGRKGSWGKFRENVPYRPGLAEFNIEPTLHNFIQRGGKVISLDDIIGIERRQKKRNIVLILDTSGSMFGRLMLNAALTASILTYAMKEDNISIILFAGKPFVLKNITESKLAHTLVEDILDSEAIGFTNISAALAEGNRQLNHSRKKNGGKCVGILISDGQYNRGEYPAYIARKYQQLNVINIPSEKVEEQKKGRQICRDIANNGKGLFFPVEKINEIPQALMRLLAKI